MIKYPSIETVFVRDTSTNLLRFGENRIPEVELIPRWTISEKIDGTNIRVTYSITNGVRAESVGGRTDKAQLPSGMLDAISHIFPPLDDVIDYFAQGRELPWDEWSVTFYGEGYGAGIQKGGGEYSKQKRFRCFDIRYGGGAWEDDPRMREICADLGIPVAPLLTDHFVGHIPETYDELFDLTGYSIVAAEDNAKHDVLPEGIVAKPLRTLLNKYGERVMYKLAFREFK